MEHCQDPGHAMPLYEPLDPQHYEIRLVRCQPRNFADNRVINAVLETVRLEDKDIEYETLSYCWGDPTVTRPIKVNGQTMQVTTNLEAALVQLRDEVPTGTKPRKLWIDAICIDQANLRERGQQVSMMYDIYRKAQTVHIWLGEMQPRASLGFDVLRRLLEKVASSRTKLNPDLDIWMSEDDRCDGIEALAYLCRAPYWKRTWVVQEVSHKGHPYRENNILHLCGQPPLPLPLWMDVRSIYGVLEREQESKKEHWSQTSGRNPDDNMEPNREEASHRLLRRLQHLDEAIEDIGQAFYPMVIATWGFMTNAILESGDIAFARYLPTLVAELRKSLATDPKDKIYGILSLLPGAIKLVPDYNKSVTEIYTEATVQLMNVTKSLFITHQACSRVKHLPSWVPDFNTPVPMPGTFNDVFEAFRTDAVTSLAYSRVGDRGLSIAGVAIDTIRHVLTTPTDSADGSDMIHLIGAWRAFYQRHVASHSPAFDEADSLHLSAVASFWRTCCITVKRTEVSTNTPFTDKDAELYETLLPQLELAGPSLDRQSHLYMAFERILLVVNDHEPFVTASGRFGIAAKGAARPDDHILVLSSAYCPFVAEIIVAANNQSRYSLRSPCYIDGVMYGEAIVDLAKARFGDESRVQAVFRDILIV